MKKYVLNCLQTSCIQVNPDQASVTAARFKIVFKPAVSNLALKPKGLTSGYKKSNSPAESTNENEHEMINYYLEASTDGTRFIPVNTNTETLAGNTYNTYCWLDVNAVQGINYYRVKSYDKAGRIEYSSVVEVAI